MTADPPGVAPIGDRLDESTAVALAEASRALIQSAPDLDDVFAVAVRCIGSLVDSVAVVWNLSPDGVWLEGRGFHCSDPTIGIRVRDAVARHRQRSSFGVLGSVVATRAPLACSSAELGLTTDAGNRRERDTFHQLVIDLDLGEMMLVPLVSREQVLGVIVTGRRTGAAAFSTSERAIVREIVDWTALALDNCMLSARLDAEVASRRDDQDERKYQAAMLEHLSDAVISTDLRGIVRGWNDAASRLYVRAAEEMVGSHLYDLIPTTIVASATTIHDVTEHLLREGQWEGEIHQVAGDGRRLELLATSRLLTDPSGAPTGFVTVIRDLTSRQRALHAQEALSKCVLDALPASTALLDRHGTIKAVNRAWKRSVIENGGDFRRCGVGVNYLEVCEAAVASGDATVAPVLSGLLGLLSGDGPPLSVEYPCDEPDGRHWFTMQAAPVEDEDGGAVVTHDDVTWRKLAADELVQHATHDPLTGLPNRVLLADRLALALGALGGGPEDRLGVLYLDVDRLQVINDSLGHGAGDRVLRAVGERTRACLDDGDSVARLGGDEFAVVSHLGTVDELTRLAERIRDSVRQCLEVGGRELVPGVGIGIVTASAGVDPETVLARADDAMRRAKMKGPAQIASLDTEEPMRVRAVLDTELALRDSIAHGGLSVAYQPVVETATRHVDGFEALVRWDHPSRGRVPPSEFIPVAEQSGLIVPLGAWVLDVAAGAASRWPGAESVAVNLSQVQLAAPGLVEMVEEVLGRQGLPPERLILEVTETALMFDREVATARLAHLRELGIRISIDDFGTGYSSFSYLRQLPVDALKIDKSFVDDLPGGGEPIVEAIIRLADAFGLDVIAEGVESEDQFAVLASMGCPHVQGYLFGRPGPVLEIEAGGTSAAD